MPYFLLLFQVAKHKHYFLPSRLLLRVRSLVKPQKAGRKTHHLVIQPDCVLTVVNIVAGVDRLGVKIIGGFTAGLGLVTHSEGTEACWEVFLSVCPFCPSALLFELHFNGSILHSPSSTLHPTVGFSSRWLHWNLLFSTDIKFNFLMWSAGKKKGTQQLLPWDGRAINVICCHYSRQIPLSLFFLSHFTLSPFLLNIFLPSLRRFLSSDAAGRHSDGHRAAVQPSVGSHRHDRQLQTGSWGVTGQRWPSLSLKWQSQTFLTELFSSNEHN